MIALIRDVVGQLKAAGVAVVLVEQRPDAVLQMADQISFMANGTVAETVAAAGLTTGSAQFQTYVGV
jgi:branched-chain amino acid transport system ATP-binding protein